MENLPHGAKNVGVGNAARGGLLAALMARTGMDGPPDALEGRFGFLNVVGPLVDRAALVDGLGESWELLANDYKPWPVGVVLNPVIDACLELRDRLGDASAGVVSVVVKGHPLLAERTDRPRLERANDCRLSSHHIAAVCFLRGSPALADVTEAALNDPAIANFRERVRVEATDAIPVGSAGVEARLEDGTVHAVYVEHARGSRARPLSDGELDDKFRTLAAGADVDGVLLLSALRSLSGSDDEAALLTL